MITYNGHFPRQRVGESEKSKQEWYANCIDYIIAAGISMNDRNEAELQLNILHGNIPNEFYKKTLNPYNVANEKYKRFPATMRNLDIMSDIVRRYVSEYFKGVHEFTISADNAEIVLKKDVKLRDLMSQLAQQAYIQELQKQIQIVQQQAQQAQQGAEQQMQQPNQEAILEQAQQNMPDVEQFVKEFNDNYIDDESKQAQDVLDYIKSVTNDEMLYLSAFFDFCSLGECYTYTEVNGETLKKEHVPVLEAYPIPNSNFFVEEHDMFARRMTLSYPQIMDMFDDVLDNKDREFLEKYYDSDAGNPTATKLLYSQYFEYYPDGCAKFTNEERDLFKKEDVEISRVNGSLYEVWHVVWRGEARQGVLTYQNEVGFTSQRIVEEGYQLNPEAGDISIEWAYEPQVYEGYRIGSRYNAVYPIKARPIPYQRDGKLPYNGIMEVLPFMGKFSIIKLITPYQIMRNIISYHREMVIAKNKMLILLLPESLVASDSEDKVYKMAADGILLVDDSEDSNSQKMANIRMLNASMGDYIAQLTNLMESIKMEAREMVDMNAQRYGEISQYAGKQTTEEAIARSSMGSIIIFNTFDELRKRDYQRDIDFAKVAYIDGLQTTFFDDKNQRRYLSLDVNTFIYATYSAMVKNSQKELDKLNQLRQWAFSAAQNGDLDMAIAAITGNNVSQIEDLVNKFMQLKRQHENELKQADQMIEQAKLQTELAKIQAQGEQDRLTEQLKYQYEMQLKYMDVDMSMLNAANDTSADATATANRLKETAEQNKVAIAQQKLSLEENKFSAEMYNKAADRQIKREQMENDLKIAKTNKNKYDKK